MTWHFTHSASLSAAHNHHFVIPERNTPDSFTGLSQFSDELPCLEVKKLYTSVVAASHQETIVELEAGHTVIVSTKAVQAFKSREAEDDDTAI